MLHKCGISPRRRHSERCGNTAQCVLVCRLRARVVQVGLGLLLSLSVSLHLSHDFPDLGSPGVSHLGHQLHSQVNCSSKWSAKQCRKKEEKNVIAMIHHRARITSAWQDQSRKLAINNPMSGVRDLLKHLKWMKRMREKWRNRNRLYIFASSVPLWIFEWLWLAFFSLISSRGNSPAGAN